MMLEMKTTQFLEALSSKEPVPGGGGASAAVGSMGAALGMMVAELTIGKKKYADAEEEIKAAKEELQQLMLKLVSLADEDAEAFKPLSKAYGLPRESKEQIEQRERVMEKALYEASVVPLKTMKTILKVMRCLELLGEKGSRLAVSDAGAGIVFAGAALEGASLNVYINTKLMKDRERAEGLNERADALIRESRVLRERVYEGVLSAIR